jgi:hypothetical protein
MSKQCTLNEFLLFKNQTNNIEPVNEIKPVSSIPIESLKNGEKSCILI